MNDPILEAKLLENRRQFFGRTSTGIGVAALASLLNGSALEAAHATQSSNAGLDGIPHFAPKAKRVIYLLQSG
ncbi:MAG: sulfatase, partial [Planctomycetota bacterium]